MNKKFILLKNDNTDSYTVAELLEETEDQVVVNYPLIIRIRGTADGLGSVQTTKVMPFSINNVVAFTKSNIIAMSRPNERVIQYYLDFIDKYYDMYEEELEMTVLDLTDDEEGYELPQEHTSNNTIH